MTNILGFFYFIDPMYIIIVGPAIILAMIAQGMVKSAYAKASRIRAGCGLSGAETAQRILNAYSINDVGIEPARGYLGDHYDSRKKMLRLSPDVYQGRSLASLGIAAHEVGHAIQDAQSYGPLVIRNGLVPMASIGSNLAIWLVIGGLILNYMQMAFGQTIALAGLVLFGAVVLFQLVNLPVEFNASSRARTILLEQGMVSPQENKTVGKVLNAAAMTYVAATITAIATLLYYALLVFGRRD